MNNAVSEQNLNRNPTNALKKCESCTSSFNFIRKKLAYCRNCIRLPGRHLPQKHKNRNSIYKYVCPKCNTISSPQATAEQLMIIEMKYLRLYLINKKISIATCREKKELVELIIRVNNNNNNNMLTNNSQSPISSASSSLSAPAMNASPSVSSDIGQVDVNIGDIIVQANNLALGRESQHNAGTSNAVAAIKRRASLSNIDSLEKLESLSVKQIKEILAANFVHYKGCYEKSELIEKLKNLYLSYEKNKKIESLLNEKEMSEILEPFAKRCTSELNLNEYELCKICMDRVIDCVLLECGHMVSCVKCGKKLAECPICRQNIVRVIRVFRS